MNDNLFEKFAQAKTAMEKHKNLGLPKSEPIGLPEAKSGAQNASNTPFIATSTQVSSNTYSQYLTQTGHPPFCDSF
jgi:hypothetical protein